MEQDIKKNEPKMDDSGRQNRKKKIRSIAAIIVLALAVGSAWFAAVRAAGGGSEKASSESNIDDPLSAESVVNILLMCQEGDCDEGRGPVDVLTLISLNRERNSIRLTTFPSNTYVKVPGREDDRLGMVYLQEGEALLNETMQMNFGLGIDGNVVMDAGTFAHVIDILGGIELELNAEEAKVLSAELGVAASEGMNQFSGEEALAYCHMGERLNGTECQQKVFSTLLQKFKSSGMRTLIRLIDQIRPEVITNLSGTEILDYALICLGMMTGDGTMSAMRIPADDAFHTEIINDVSVLIPDFEMCREDLVDFICSK